MDEGKPGQDLKNSLETPYRTNFEGCLLDCSDHKLEPEVQEYPEPHSYLLKRWR